jgi:hypothetical protein
LSRTAASLARAAQTELDSRAVERVLRDPEISVAAGINGVKNY